jgi:hypothetical protein
MQPSVLKIIFLKISMLKKRKKKQKNVQIANFMTKKAKNLFPHALNIISFEENFNTLTEKKRRLFQNFQKLYR